jgi:membrane-bound lytic murein transglycosylase D
LNRRYLIVAGKVLKVPTAKSYRKKYQSGPKKIPAKHVVKSGDSLWILARRYNTTTKAIQRLNNLRTTRLHIGQKLRIPGAKGSQKKAVAKENKNLKKYYVKRGDAPVKIAKKHHMSLQRFLKLNQLKKWSKIYPGQTLYVE